MERKHVLILLGILSASIILITGIALLRPQATFWPFEPVAVEKQAGIFSDYWAATPTPFADTKESDIVSATVNFYGMQLGELSEAERA